MEQLNVRQETPVRVFDLAGTMESPMSQYSIAVVVGSLRRESFNKRLATAMARLAPQEFSFSQVRIDDLPLYNQDDDNNPAETVRRLKAEITAADAVMFVTPEYNRSIPGVLKNALDHASRPYGKSVWKGKPAGVIGISPGAIGTAIAQQHLRTVLAYLDMPTLGQPEVFLQMKDDLFNQDGSVGEKSRDFLQGWMDRFVEWVKAHAPAMQPR
jgi:chromate reductase